MSEPWPIKDEELDRWEQIQPDHVHGRCILRLIAEVRGLREQLKAVETNERERVEADGARGWHWETVQEIAARVLARIVCNEDISNPVKTAVDYAEALVAEVTRRRERGASDGV